MAMYSKLGQSKLDPVFLKKCTHVLYIYTVVFKPWNVIYIVSKVASKWSSSKIHSNWAKLCLDELKFIHKFIN